MDTRVGRSYYNRKGIMVNVFATGKPTEDFAAGRFFRVREEMQKSSTYWVDANGLAGDEWGDLVSEWGA